MSDSEVHEEAESVEQAQESEESSEDEAAKSTEQESSESDEHGSGEDGSDEGGSEEEEEVRRKAEAQAAERRKAYRLNKVLGATMTSTDGDATRTRLFVIDISVSGFRATDHRPPDQEDCDISIVLVKDQEPFVSRMRVVWVKELTVSGMYQMGCEFIDPADGELAKLNAFIELEKNKASEASGKSPIKIVNPWTMI